MKPRNPLHPLVMLLVALTAVLPACNNRSWETGRNSSDLPTGTLVINGDRPLVLEVDLALTSKAQARGLMKVEKIPDDYGMVFLRSDSRKQGFYMKNTDPAGHRLVEHRRRDRRHPDHGAVHRGPL